MELSENQQVLAELYEDVSNRLKMAPLFTAQVPLPPGVLAFPTVLADAVLYDFASDSADAAAISLRDQTTGVALSFSLPAEHSAIAVIGKREKKIVAKYGF